MRQVEILAPAGSLESLYGALKLGADAVYVGTSRFGARAFADNPTVSEIEKAITYAHLRRKKIYLTVNTLLNDRELEEELFPMIKPLYEAGLDACIVQDLGVLSFLHDNFPEMDLHASTQMTLFSGDEANLLKPYGVTRYVPARELTIEEIREARKQTDLEIEVFVHGALCYCYSGQCLMSEVIGGRSGNRGMCAGPCRLPYQTPFGNGYVLNTKDICTLMRIPELVDAGIDSFKIEGRMKKREYSAFLASVYRKYVTLYQEEGQEFFRTLVENRDSELWADYKKCQDLYNRGGFSESYLFEREKKRMVYPKKNGHFGTYVGEVKKFTGRQAVFVAEEELNPQDVLEFREKDDTTAYEYTLKDAVSRNETVTANVKRGSHIFPGQKVYRRKNAVLAESIARQIEETDDRYPLTGVFTGQTGEPVVFSVCGNGVTVSVKGDILQEAANRPVSGEDIKKNLGATGNTDYYFSEISVSIPAHSFLPMGGIKKLRREAIAKWEEQGAPGRRSPVEYQKREFSAADCRREENWVGISSTEQLTTTVECCKTDVLYVLKLLELPPEQWETAVEILAGQRYALEFPRILRGKGKNVFEKMWEQHGPVFFRVLPKAIVVNSYRSLIYAGNYFGGIIRYADDNIYRENKRAVAVCQELGMIPAPKRNYGRTAVMVSRGCIFDTMGLCNMKSCTMTSCRKKDGRVSLLGPKGDEFTAVSHCRFCTNTIYTQKPVTDKPGQMQTARVDFTWETCEEVRKVIREWNL